MAEVHERRCCIMPEQPYCPACPFGREEVPGGAETYDDLHSTGVEWVCSATLEKVKAYLEEPGVFAGNAIKKISGRLMQDGDTHSL